MSGGRRGITIAVGLLILFAVAAAVMPSCRPSGGKQWPPGSDEERIAQSLAAYDHERRWDTVSELVEVLGIDIEGDPSQRNISRVAQEIAAERGNKAIPLLIGAIDADNSYQTAYLIGNSVLRHLTGVEYSQFHDGAWWRRWWETHCADYPLEVRDLPIPAFDKTDHGLQYVPFPEDTDTLQGKLRQIPLAIAEDLDRRHGSSQEPRLSISFLADEIAEHRDPRAIPYLIALLDINPADTTYVRRALRNLTRVNDQTLVPTPAGQGEWHDPATGRAYTDRFTSSWWRQWWADHRTDYPAAQAIDIPDYARPLSINM